MTIRNILVSYNATPAADAALALARRLALMRDGHLTGVLSYGPQEIITSYAGYMPAGVAEQLVEADLTRRDEVMARFGTLTSDMDPSRVHFRDVFSSADNGLMDVARCYDIIVMGRAEETGAFPHMEPHPDVVARHSGRPVLVVPAGYAGTTCATSAMIAWDGGRAASRALSDALPLLTPEAVVRVVTIGRPEDSAALDPVATHLARHGLAVERDIRQRRPGRSVAQTLLEGCGAGGVDLLIMGAYEHSKFAEDLFGGVTDTVLRNTPIPVLLSH
ncbi:universal stress protein [Paroceanicella profunda]|uniref:universal stress protein n=1 Tax=Paroceanicella profunda TaxID=2579971 RepID=UPI0014782626|nr:universal stress protein [Paroceanicella profunda]